MRFYRRRGSSSSSECTIRALNAAAKDRRNEERIALTAGRTFRASNAYRYTYRPLSPVRLRTRMHAVRTRERSQMHISLRANDACVTCEQHHGAHTRKNLATRQAAGVQFALRSPACEAHGCMYDTMQGGRQSSTALF